MKAWYLALAGVLAVPAMASAQISQVTYGSLTGTQLVTFDELVGGFGSGTNYDGVLYSGGVGFAERFVGQTLTDVSGFDQLGGAPTGGALTLLAGAAGRNLRVGVAGTSLSTLAGLGSKGFPLPDALGEGSFAARFSSGQSQIGFRLFGGDSFGFARLSFFRADGSVIQDFNFSTNSGPFGFSRDGGVKDIFGFSLYNDDFGGIAFDDLKFDVVSVGPSVPEPTAVSLLAAGLGLLGAAARRRRNAAA